MKVPNYAFVENSKKFFILSLLLIAVSIIGVPVLGVSLDIQFSGGAIIAYSFEGELDSADVTQTAGELTGVPISVQQSTDLATGTPTMVISLPGGDSLTSEQMVALNNGMALAFPGNNLQVESITNVSATMGTEFLQKSLIAVAFASLLVVLFVAIRFKRIGGFSAGITGVIALVHDVIIVFGVHVIAGIPLSGNFIAVVLTVLGYSINDTIVIYDRVRENKRLYGDKLPLAQLMDKSINQSLRRSVNTSISTVACMAVVAVVALVFGVDTIVTFALPMIVGLIAGSYSSIFIAGPLWVRWQERAVV